MPRRRARSSQPRAWGRVALRGVFEPGFRGTTGSSRTALPAPGPRRAVSGAARRSRNSSGGSAWAIVDDGGESTIAISRPNRSSCTEPAAPPAGRRVTAGGASLRTRRRESRVPSVRLRILGELAGWRRPSRRRSRSPSGHASELPRARAQEDARAVAGAGDRVARLRRAVHEVPLLQRTLLPLDDRHRLAGERHEVLLTLSRSGKSGSARRDSRRGSHAEHPGRTSRLRARRLPVSGTL